MTSPRRGWWRRLEESIAVKILVPVLVAVVIVVGFYSYLALKTERRWLALQHRAAGEIVHHFATSMMAGDAADHSHSISDTLASLRDVTGAAAVHVTTPSKRIAFSSEAALVDLVLPIDDQKWAAADAGVDGGVVTVGGEPVRSLAPLHNRQACQKCHDPAETLLGMVVIEQRPVGPFLASFERPFVIYAGFVVAMVSSVLLLLVWLLVQNPLSRLAKAVQAVQEGDLDVHCAVPGHDQLARLAQGFNSMVESLKQTTSEVQALHATQMAQADRLAGVGQLAAGLAHEIKNPLHGLKAALSVLHDQETDAEKKDIMAEMRREVERVVHIVGDLLYYARPLKPKLQPCRVDEILAGCLALLQPAMKRREIRIDCRIDQDLPELQADPEKLKQIFLNLLLNASQVSEANGRLLISARVRKPTHQLEVRIEDSGPGVPPELVDKIFMPFFTTKSDGNGLGLAITRQLVEQHHGRIELVPATTVGGACFQILLPFKAEDED